MALPISESRIPVLEQLDHEEGSCTFHRNVGNCLTVDDILCFADRASQYNLSN